MYIYIYIKYLEVQWSSHPDASTTSTETTESETNLNLYSPECV